MDLAQSSSVRAPSQERADVSLVDRMSRTGKLRSLEGNLVTHCKLKLIRRKARSRARLDRASGYNHSFLPEQENNAF